MQDNENNGNANEKVSQQEILRIAALARIEIKEDDLEKMKTSFTDIMNLFDEIKDVDLTTVDISYESCKTSQPPREDKIIHDSKGNNAKIAKFSPYYNDKTRLIDVPLVIETE
jgi:aspartyl/glutamyl-tRNA(Asn/Gln) amidotransferase C subunit